MEKEYEYNIWKLTVNFVFFKRINRHLHDLHIYDGYRRFYDLGIHPYNMAEILIHNLEHFIEGTGETE